MSDDIEYQLFVSPETLSPRLAWIKKYGIQTRIARHGWALEEPWAAYFGDVQFAIANGNYETGATEDDAITNLAKAYGWPLWNEEGFKG